MSMQQISGLLPVLVTPMTADGAIDEAGLRRLCAYLSTFPIAGVWALGTGSEDMNLTMEKRVRVAEIVSESFPQSIPVMMGTSFFAMEDSLAFIDRTKHLPFSSYHVMPYHPLISAERLAWYYEALADYAPKPLWLYTSANWSQQLPHPIIARLAKHPNICGIKYSTRLTTDITKVAEMQNPGFQMITAVATQTYACLCMGSPAGTSSVGSAMPEPLLEIFQLYKAGDLAGAQAAQRRLNAFLDAMPKSAKKDNFLGAAEEKYILSLRGICEPHVSSYYRALDEAEQAQVRRALEDSGYMVHVERTRARMAQSA